ncbi:hypothetical protein DEM34_19300 [Spiribacter halobius]|uniref:GmrSD restriction endonucleases C-terminal domain-containing protein n=2 Tax=Sediminicurvatus halobius TaxID=2182432 RepID=A0A2U2MVP0_9GAMM|nr:hypothetical protein DEM34_19300 [Spiribacter halobius]
MVPLSKGKNDKIGNKPWPEKKPILASSEMLLTRDAAKRPKWDQSAIQERQEEMAKLALEAWPREP